MSGTTLLNRKQFIQSHGATCKNWTWSWSFVNHEGRTVIFGAWDIHAEEGRMLILDKAWAIENGRKNAAYPQSLEHLRLVEEQGYQLYTFTLFFSDELQDKDGNGPAKIKGFERKLVPRSLIRSDGKWYASNTLSPTLIPEEIAQPELFFEGALSRVAVNAFERNQAARDACIRHHGAVCAVCSFDFGTVYGAIGQGLIHVHHIVPLKDIRQDYKVDPIRDLVPVCPNCHAIIHRTSEAMEIAKLKEHLAAARAH